MKFLVRLRLQTRVILLVVAGLVTVVTVLGLQATWDERDEVALALEGRLTLARATASHLERFLEKSLSELTAAVTALENLAPGDLPREMGTHILQVAYANGATFGAGILLVDRNGQVLAKVPETAAISKDLGPWIQEGLQKGQPIVSGLVLTPENRPSVWLGVPVRDRAGRVTGLLLGGVDLTAPPIVELIRPTTLSYGGYSQVIDESGMVLADSTREGLFQPARHANILLPLLRERRTVVITATVEDEPGQPFREVIAFAPLKLAPWAVTVEQAEAEILRPLREVWRRFALLGGLMLLVSVLIARAAVQGIIRPVSILTAAARRLRDGDLETPVPPLGQDELGVLGRTFEEMRQQLKAARDELAAWTGELEHRVQQRTWELSTLVALSTRLRAARNLEEMLPLILHRAVEVARGDAGILLLLDDERNEAIVRAAYGWLTTVQGIHFPLRDSEFENCVRTGGMCSVAELRAKLDWPPLLQEVLDRMETGLGIALRTVDEAVGIIVVSGSSPHLLTEEEIRLLQAIADLAANAIQRTTLFEKAVQRADQQARLLRFSRELLQVMEVQHVVNRAATLATELLEADFSAVLLAEEGDHRLMLVSGTGWLPASGAPLRVRIGDDSLTGYALQHKQPVAVEDSTMDGQLQISPVPPGRVVRSALAVPMLASAQTIGVLLVYERKQRCFTSEDTRLLALIANHTALALERIRLFRAEQARAQELEEAYLGTVLALANAIDAKDTYTGGHGERLAELALAVGRAMGLSPAELEDLRWAALLHDVGKIGVPDAILQKPGPLAPEEWAIMRRHPITGAEILAPIPRLQRVAAIVRAHHERWDGKGYPDGLVGEAIPLEARILAVVDAYSAITDERIYKRARSHEEALAELRRCAGSQFDPRVVEVFLRLMEKQEVPTTVSS